MLASFYDPSTGLFVGRRFSGPAQKLEANTPEGLVAIEGHHDPASKRVDLASGEVVDYAPAVDATAVAASEAAERRANALARIRALEERQHRAVREMSLDPTNTDARARLESIEGQIAQLRAQL